MRLEGAAPATPGAGATHLHAIPLFYLTWSTHLDTLGRHMLVEYDGCDPELLDNEASVRLLLVDAAKASGATVVSMTFHRYSPQGVSGVVVIAESHLSIHTWPEQGYAAADFYTCGFCEPERAHQVLLSGLRATDHQRWMLERGRLHRGKHRISLLTTQQSPVTAPHGLVRRFTRNDEQQ